jgi:CheY-like chemotaxis protein
VTRPPCVLVVDDNPDNLLLVDYVLRAHGHAPLLARDGHDAIRLALTHCPDLVLLDIRMPGIDGYEVAAAIRGEPSLLGMRVVAMTASVMAADRERVRSAGFDGYIAKPIDPETFMDTLGRYLEPPARHTG